MLKYFKITVLSVVLLMIYAGWINLAFAAQSSNVDIAKDDDRSEAYVKMDDKTQTDESNPNGIELAGTRTEKAIYDVARFPNTMMGKGTELTIKGFQKVCGPTLGPVFRFFDIKTWIKKFNNEQQIFT